MAELVYSQETFLLIGAAMEVHKTLGRGFLEAVYQEALQIEFGLRQIPFTAQQELAIVYKGKHLNKIHVADFVAYSKIIIEIKALDCLTNREEAQLINYLKATGYTVGLLFNFGANSLEWDRRILTSTGKFISDQRNPRNPRIQTPKKL